ncbi:MAG TPA: alpha/beta fold hydrolase [Nocardioidaceae bacterium]|nr:alpha/beta fold hydrolase [Nocardioidaceae bacterium]
MVAPRLGAHVATRLWMTLPPPARAGDLPPGGRAFEVGSQRSTVRGRVWGDGPVVYLVHGWGGRTAQLAALVQPLVAAGHTVVGFDGLSHGDSDPGPSGPRSATGVELGKALDDVAARFGPARAIVAHSMGAVASLLAMRYGWLTTDRLVLLAPMNSYAKQFEPFQQALGIGPRIRRLVDQAVVARVGLPVEEFDVRVLARHLEPVPTLLVHDTGDRQTAYDDTVILAAELPEARLVTTSGLGHRQILRDPQVVDEVVSFIGGDRLVGARTAGVRGHEAT